MNEPNPVPQTSLFNADTFLNETVTGSHDTKYPVIPAGDYPAISKKVDAREMANTKKPQDGPFTVLDITWGIDDAAVKEATAMDEPTCRQSVFLDLHEGKLDMREKKNIGLGRLRETLGLNDPTVPFSFNNLVGQPAIVRIEQSPNPKDPENPYSNVTKVAQI